VCSAISNPIRPYGSVEWLILDLLLEHSHRSWGVGELVDEIGSPIAVAEALESHASRLRRKLNNDGERWITNVHGVGYRLM